MYTHRGAWVNAIGEITEHGLTQRSVYLWTLPMFHCNGWCFPWAVTAAGGRHVCMRQPDPREIVRAHRDRRRDPPLRRARRGQFARPVSAPPTHVKFQHPLRIVTAGAPPAARRHPRRRRNRRRNLLTPMASPKPTARTPSAPGIPSGTPCPPPNAPSSKPARACAYMVAGTDLRVVDLHMNDVPRRRRDHGRSAHARQQRHARLLRQSQSHRGRLSRRLVPLRRSRRGPPRWLHRTARPHEGHRHFRRRKYLFHRSRKNPGRSSRRRRSRDRGRAR